MFQKNNLTMALNISHIKEKEICPANISTINSTCEKHGITWNYLQNINLIKNIKVIFIV